MRKQRVGPNAIVPYGIIHEIVIFQKLAISLPAPSPHAIRIIIRNFTHACIPTAETKTFAPIFFDSTLQKSGFLMIFKHFLNLNG